MPFLRLIIIYIVVIAIVFAIFNRDRVMQLAGFSLESSESGKVDEAAIVAEIVETAPVPEKTAEITETAVTMQTETEPQQAAPAPVDQSPKQQAVPATANPNADLKSSLDEVRKAFWGGDAQKAETLYVALAAQYEADANIQGETGNFFYSQRRYPEAAKYFHRAGLLLVNTGNKQQVMSIIIALQQIAPDKATDLRARAAKQP
ncbi:MAG: hypothetical protein KUG74_04810 [Rhodobacteraceae bacterium]|nr:hypothetical protein [Paracoccaceae bacterium]